MTIAENIAGIRERIAVAAESAGRDPAGVRLVGVSKGVAPPRVQQAIDSGLVDFGENFVQEAQQHVEALGEGAKLATWHFIGHLQTNKAGDALSLFDMIQSVDSVRLAEQLSRRATANLRVLLEVNVSGEASKFGFAPAEVGDAVKRVGALPHIELAGLMTVAPAAANPDAARPVFRELRELATANSLNELSMGMSADFEVAISEGATIVRIGRAIFGERPS